MKGAFIRKVLFNRGGWAAAGGVGPCKHTLNLFEAANASGSDLCSAERLPDCIKDVNEVSSARRTARL